MRLPTLSAIGILFTTVHAALKTSIWIDQLPAYSALAPCAENRVSAIVRAQASGCGDDQQLTSFSCFCIDQSSHMSSMLSTAVQEYCAASATTLPASLTTPLPEVTAALDVFNSYCARSTELVWYQQNSTAQTTPPITTAPSTLTTSISTSPSSASSSTQPSTARKSVPVAAIAAPVVIGILALLGVVCLLFFLRRRKAHANASTQNPYAQNGYAPPTYTPRGELEQAEVHEVQSPAHEMVGGESVKYRSELETRPAELEGEGAGKGYKHGSGG
ncbi:hypothetical protein EKO04_006659 [Ascochyta lentis]|uniref:Extracellular membrane protein CFEM domain-containing protein n=1 Tax=Ascochyta lentis TaxID=205686 RepID=A0A8H7J4X2_9PLEO|nr:hypothetical protein EKO04_006659 [Ascochyta lentis]